jgi:hypothetical protein
MAPEEVVKEIVRAVFPHATVTGWREEDKQYNHFEFRLVAGNQVWGLNRTYLDEELHRFPDLVAKQFVRDIRFHMEKEMSVENDAIRKVLARELEDRLLERGGEKIYEMGSSAPIMTISPITGMPKSTFGGYKDGWYDTDQARQENARLLELARIASEHQEAERAKESILDTIAKRAMRD